MDDPVATKTWRRFVWRVALAGPLLLVALHLIGDTIYAAYVACASDSWEASAKREASGVLAGCEGYELDPSGEKDRDTAIVLVHGLGASPRHYDLVAPALAELGYRVRVVRLPGFAEPLERYRASKAADWTGAVAAALDELRGESARVGVVGHSLGGATTLRVLLDNPEAADFAVLLAPAIAPCDTRSPLLSARSWREVSKRTLVFTRVFASAFPMDCRDRSREKHPGRTPFTPTSVVDELFGVMDANAPQAKRLRLPLTMMVSRDDLVVDTPAAVEYFERVESTDKELVVLERSGHELPLDVEWRAVVEAIDRRARAADAGPAGD